MTDLSVFSISPSGSGRLQMSLRPCFVSGFGTMAGRALGLCVLTLTLKCQGKFDMLV